MPSEYNPNETRKDWETVQKDLDSETQRLRIKGGWLYRTVSMTMNAVALVFVPVHSEDAA